MQVKHVLLIFLAVAVAAVAILAKRDYDFRQLNGRVTEVGYLNWEQEVLQADKQTPLLIYFYKDDGQKEAVADFAWGNAGDVKVVACDVTKIENMALAIAHGAFRFPAYILVKGDDILAASAGKAFRQEDLERLLKQAGKP
ncbi:MAG: hypothetical protein K8F91_23930 [Candidatus Obscuribacterales bacterium]|nr:hypothetical protein [Candidatus Obscuribacterales bacterium]